MRFFREIRLETMCLKIIVGHLERYYQHEESINKYNQFLQRRYSDKICNELIKCGRLTEDFVYWLISPFWNDVIIGKTHRVSKFVPKLKHFGEAITSINLENSSATFEILSAVICCLPNLKLLNLCFTNCSDDLLLLIRKMCPQLNELNVSDCDVTDDGMINLCTCPPEKAGFESLKVLNIESTLVKYKGVAYLLKYLNLQVLKYYDLPNYMCNLYSSKVDWFVDGYNTHNFIDLSFNVNKLSSRTSLTQVLEAWVVQCPYVERLAILEEMKVEHLQLCLLFEKLKSITFMGRAYEIHNSVSNFIKLKGANLSEIVLHNTRVSVEVIARFCHNLKKLHLVCIMYEYFDESDIQSDVHYLDKVTKLKVKHVYICDKESYKSIYLLLKLCRNVEHLSISFVQNFSEQFIDIIISMPHLNKAKFPFTDINEDLVKELFNCQNINRVCFDGCPYISKNSELLKSLVQVKHGNTLSWQIDFNELLDVYE